MYLKRCYFLAFLSALLLGSEVVAQAPSTVWHALGIPQAYKCIADARLNRKGKHPGLERKPPLKALADPANLKSDVPAIKKAAEIKQQEDLAPQKVKAVKYLGQIGCGCYGGVAEALTAALEDCTEEVRYAAALSIVQALYSNCQVCKKTCCTKELAAKMHERAYAQDETGCFLEPSERVRAVLMEALNDCPPDMRDIGPVIIPDDTVPPDAVPPPDAPLVPPADGAASVEEGTSDVPHTSRRPENTSLLHRSSARSALDESQLDSQALFAPAPEVPMVPRQVIGEVIAGKTRGGFVRIQFNQQLRPAVGSEVEVYHAYVLGTEFTGRLVIAEYDGDVAIAAPQPWESVKVARGDTVKCLVLAPAVTSAPAPTAAPSPPSAVEEQPEPLADTFAPPPTIEPRSEPVATKFAPPPVPEPRKRAPEHRLTSTRELLLPPPPAPSAPKAPARIERLPVESAPEPVERQLDARLLDILQPPPVVVEDEEVAPPVAAEATFEVPPVYVEPETESEPVKQASAVAPLYPVVDNVPAPPVQQAPRETLAPIVSPPKVVKKKR